MLMPLQIREKAPLSRYTIYKIGGPSRFFAEVKNKDELIEALTFALENNLRFFLLGAGSNVLVSDKGYDGLVIRMNGGKTTTDGTFFKADAGVMMAVAVLETAKAGLAGFEWGIGVPGTIGGSVRGNAGSFGRDMAAVIEEVEALAIGREKRKFDAIKFSNGECRFDYRDSIFKKHPEWVILSATIRLKPGKKEEILKTVQEISQERAAKQDIGSKSCGCIFKNVSWERKDINKEKLLKSHPELEKFADKSHIPSSFLIDQAGLKGKKIGRVIISPKHANFFVNEGGATAEEVILLIAVAKDAVKRKFGIVLEEEIQYVGFE